MLPRVSTAIDVHAFKPGELGQRLGGVWCPQAPALLGHSDADVILHALADCLFALAGEGDIGQHFPPSEAQWRGADSAVFIAKAMESIRDASVQLTFVDVTVVGEQPKIAPLRALIRHSIAELCDISPELVAVKATTTEQLGFLGRGEGLLAMVTVSAVA